MNSVYSSNHDHTTKKGAMPGPNPGPLLAKQSHSPLRILRRKIWATAGNEPGSKVCNTKTIQMPLRVGGRTDLNADVAVMRTGYEPVSTKEGRGRNWAGEGDQNLQINLRFQCLHIFLHFLNEKPKLGNAANLQQ